MCYLPITAHESQVMSKFKSISPDSTGQDAGEPQMALQKSS